MLLDRLSWLEVSLVVGSGKLGHVGLPHNQLSSLLEGLSNGVVGWLAEETSVNARALLGWPGPNVGRVDCNCTLTFNPPCYTIEQAQKVTE